MVRIRSADARRPNSPSPAESGRRVGGTRTLSSVLGNAKTEVAGRGATHSVNRARLYGVNPAGLSTRGFSNPACPSTVDIAGKSPDATRPRSPRAPCRGAAGGRGDVARRGLPAAGADGRRARTDRSSNPRRRAAVNASPPYPTQGRDRGRPAAVRPAEVLQGAPPRDRRSWRISRVGSRA